MGITFGPEGYRPCFMSDGFTVIYETIAASPILMKWDSRTHKSTAQAFLNPAKPGLAQTRPDVSTSDQVVFTGFANNANQIYFADTDGGSLSSWEWTGLIYPCWTPLGTEYDVNIMATQTSTHALVSVGATVSATITPTTVYAGMGSVNLMATAAFAGQASNNNNQYDEENNRIWSLPSGGIAKQLDPDQGRAPWWYFDGSYIAFESNRSADKRYAIYAILADGSIVYGPYTDATMDAHHPKFSPLGDKMVFSAKKKETGAKWQVAIIDPWSLT